MRWLLISAGFLCVALGVVGVVLPLLPTTPFILLAAACFARSSTRFYNWLLSNRVFGPAIINWQETRTIPKKSKYMAITSVIVTGAISIYILTGKPLLQVAMVMALTIPIVTVLRVPSSEDLAERRAD